MIGAGSFLPLISIHVALSVPLFHGVVSVRTAASLPHSRQCVPRDLSEEPVQILLSIFGSLCSHAELSRRSYTLLFCDGQGSHKLDDRHSSIR